MIRQTLRFCLWGSLLIASAFALWAWFRPYDWNPDPAARCTVVASLVTPDTSFYWLEVHVKMNPGMSHDLQKPVYLHTGDAVKLEPADTTLAGEDGKVMTEMWFKFWLDSTQIKGPLHLQINEGKLLIKQSSAVPNVGKADFKNYTTNDW